MNVGKRAEMAMGLALVLVREMARNKVIGESTRLGLGEIESGNKARTFSKVEVQA